MTRSSHKTTKENLEAKFDAGEEVLDYFDFGRARIVRPDDKPLPTQKAAGRVVVKRHDAGVWQVKSGDVLSNFKKKNEAQQKKAPKKKKRLA